MHAYTGVPCQDKTVFYRKGAVAASVLADGAGSLKHSAEGAQAVASAVAVWLVGAFRRLVSMTDDAIRCELAGVVSARLAGLAARMGCSYSDFGSTLLAVCVSTENNHRAYLALHLGDGMICCAGDDGRFRPLSLPERAANSGCATYLTTTLAYHGMLEHIRVWRGGGEAARFIIMSDGAENSLYAEAGKLLSPSLGALARRAADHPLRFDAEFKALVRDTVRPMDDFSLSILSLTPLRLTSMGYDTEGRRACPRARRVARTRLRYANARDQNASIGAAARQAGWRKGDLKKKFKLMQTLGVEAPCRI